MRNNKPLIIFGYSFPHKKTYDFMTVLSAMGFRNIIVLAAPKLDLALHQGHEKEDQKKLDKYCVEALCRALNFKFVECAHDNVRRISEINHRLRAQTAIISGARILKKEVIDLFPKGVVNFHPGMIPETSGLDSFYHSIDKNCPMGVTCHLIDHKVDAGKFIFFEELRVETGQDIQFLKESLYALQLLSLKRYLKNYYGRHYNFKEIDRPQKNKPLTTAEKYALTKRLPEWIAEQEVDQVEVEKLFFDSCAEGHLFSVKKLLLGASYLIRSRSPEGWTGLIIAAFFQRYEVVQYLIELGADVNATGIKGTTVLMYAKTKVLQDSSLDFSLIRLLLKAGADVYQTDVFDKDVFAYLEMANVGDARLAKVLRDFVAD